MKFRKKESLSFKLSRNISRVTSLKSVLNINIEGTRARRKFRRKGTPASKARGHAKNLGTRARQHRRHEGTPFNRLSLSLVIDKGKTNWDVFLPDMVAVYCTTPRTVTRETPVFLMFGRQFNVPPNVRFEPAAR